MKYLLLSFLLIVSNSLFAQVSINNSKQEALDFLDSIKGTLDKREKNYIEATSFKKDMVGGVKPKKIAIYTNQNDIVYLVIYTFAKAKDRDKAMAGISKVDYDKSKIVSAHETKEYLQMTRNEMDGQDAIFILMDVPKTLEFAANDYAVFKKMVNAWQSKLSPAPAGTNLLGKTYDDFQKLATKSSPYTGNTKQGQYIFKNGEVINGFKPTFIDAVFDENAKIVQAIWIFSDAKQWNDFLHKVAGGMDLLIQSDYRLQDILAKGESVEYDLNKEYLVRFWYDKYGLGVAFADRAWSDKMAESEKIKK